MPQRVGVAVAGHTQHAVVDDPAQRKGLLARIERAKIEGNIQRLPGQHFGAVFEVDCNGDPVVAVVKTEEGRTHGACG